MKNSILGKSGSPKKFRSVLALVLPCSLLAFGASATKSDNEQHQAMHKQLNIMGNIIKSSLTNVSESNWSKLSSIDSTYLHGQGVVFTIRANARRSSWGNYNISFAIPDVPVAPVAPISEHFHDDDLEIEVNETVNEAIELATMNYENAMSTINVQRSDLRELHEKQRSISYELRDLNREKRDLEYQLRRADKEAKKELDKAIKRVEEQRKEIEKSKLALKKDVELLHKKQLAEKTKQQKERVAYYKALEVALADTFCTYGNGLKALPKDENINVIIKSGGNKSAGQYQDNILVFSKKNIMQCASDKINAKTLLSKSEGYSF